MCWRGEGMDVGGDGGKGVGVIEGGGGGRGGMWVVMEGGVWG